MLADLSVVVITWTRMFSPVKEAMKVHSRMSTSMVVLADGEWLLKRAKMTLTSVPGSLYFV